MSRIVAWKRLGHGIHEKENIPWGVSQGNFGKSEIQIIQLCPHPSINTLACNFYFLKLIALYFFLIVSLLYSLYTLGGSARTREEKNRM